MPSGSVLMLTADDAGIAHRPVRGKVPGSVRDHRTILYNAEADCLIHNNPIHFCRAFFDPIPVFIRHFDYCVDGYLAAKGKTDVISIF